VATERAEPAQPGSHDLAVQLHSAAQLVTCCGHPRYASSDPLSHDVVLAAEHESRLQEVGGCSLNDLVLLAFACDESKTVTTHKPAGIRI
jgi:hypothetical protein